MLQDAGAVAVVTEAGAPPAWTEGLAAVVHLGLDSDEDGPPDDGAAGDVAYVVYTSGSTGLPRGVAVEHRSLHLLVEWHTRAFGVTAADGGSLIASPGFDASVWEVWPYLAAGASLHVPAGALHTDPVALRDWMLATGLTIGFVPTGVAEALMALRWPQATALRCLLTGGDTLQRRPPHDLPFRVVNNYGVTEATVVSTSGTVSPADESGSLPSIGRAVDGAELHVVDTDLRPVVEGESGELLHG